MINLADDTADHIENAAWMFATRGLCTVAQDELVFIFRDEAMQSANEIISDLLTHIHQIYLDATKGNDSTSNQMSHSLSRFSSGSFIRHLSLSLWSGVSTFLSSSKAVGFLHLSDSNTPNEYFPESPYLFCLLIHREELPTAQCFPMRLLLRLGYEYQSKLRLCLHRINHPGCS